MKLLDRFRKKKNTEVTFTVKASDLEDYGKLKILVDKMMNDHSIPFVVRQKYLHETGKDNFIITVRGIEWIGHKNADSETV